MAGILKKQLLIIVICCLTLLSQTAFAKPRILTQIKVVHAATGQHHIDPQLTGMIRELQSVFKYTSYRLLNQKKMPLGFNEKGRMNLPGKRTLVVIPLSADGKRIRYQIHIRKNNRSVFQTQVLLKNNRSITIGGPEYKNGYLLFNISGSIR